VGFYTGGILKNALCFRYYDEFYSIWIYFILGFIVDEEKLIEAVKKKTVLKAIVVELIKNPDLLHMIAEAALGRVATKEDVAELRKEIVEFRKEMQMWKEDIIKYIDARYESLDKRIDGLDKGIDSLDKRIDSLDKRIDALDKRISLLQWVIVIWFTILSILTTLSVLLR